MKISLQWLKDYVEIDVSVKELEHRLTMAGLEVESIETKGKDSIFELEITPNRADCLNMIGMAREISAILDKKLILPKIKTTKKVSKKCSVDIQDKENCQQYVASLICDIKISASEKNISQRLESLGINCINNIVDITNFSLWENGQPLHAFDFDKIEGGQIIVRKAKKGEKIVTIDGIERELDPTILVIADAKKLIAIAGIMGGKETEVTASTKNILLESAYFNPVLIRRTSRKLALTSDSAYRFERGVMREGVEQGSRRAQDLILTSAGGNVQAQANVLVSKGKEKSKTIQTSLEFINQRLGAEITLVKCKNILLKLGFSVEATKSSLKVTAPAHRSDIHADVDIVEEIARVIGFDNLPTSLPQIKPSMISTNPKRILRQKLRSYLVAQGLDEIVTFSMFHEDALKRTNIPTENLVRITNPLSLDQEIMRPSLLPSFLSVAQMNINRGQRDLKLFESGKIYLPGGEKETLGVLMCGLNNNDWRELKKKSVDFYDLKGVVELSLLRLGVKNFSFKKIEDNSFEQGQAAQLMIDQKPCGVLGLLREEILQNWSVRLASIYFAQIDLSIVFANIDAGIHKFTSLCEYPSVTRDISIAAKKQVLFDDICAVIHSQKNDILSAIDFKEEYLGDKISDEKRGLIFSLTYQSLKRTLKEDEVQQVHERILKALIDELEIVIR